MVDKNESLSSLALKAESNNEWSKSENLWEKLLIETVNSGDIDWFSRALVILSHIYDISYKHLGFKPVDEIDRILYDERCKPVGYWDNQKAVQEKINELNSSESGFIFKIVLAVVIFVAFFILLRYPFSGFEVTFMSISFIVIILGLSIGIGLLFNIVAGIVSFIAGIYSIDIIGGIVMKVFGLADSDMGALYVLRFIAIIIVIVLLYSAYKSKINVKEVRELVRIKTNNAEEMKRHAKECLSAAFRVDNLLSDDEMEIAAIRVKKAYADGDIYHFGKVNKNNDEWEDAYEVVKSIAYMHGYYKDMNKLYNEKGTD